MLIVTRHPSEPLVIELPTRELIEVVVLSGKGNQVKLGTDAPDEILVLREELLEGAAQEHQKSQRPEYSDAGPPLVGGAEFPAAHSEALPLGNGKRLAPAELRVLNTKRAAQFLDVSSFLVPKSEARGTIMMMRKHAIQGC